jgi:hypothetical protein
MMPSHLFGLMQHVFIGFAVSLGYGATTSLIIWFFDPIQLNQYLKFYFVSFNCVVSGGLIIGAAIFVYRTQESIPQFVEKSFDEGSLRETKFFEWRDKYLSTYMTMKFSTEFIIVGFVTYIFCKFPIRGIPEYFMIAFGCLQYGLGVYVGRKLFNIANMLNSMLEIRITKNIFKEDELSNIINYVNILSTFTIVFVYVHVKSYFEAPFEYSTPLGIAPKVALLLPVVIATPVLVIFNFYPRAALKKLYSRSIKQEVEKLTESLKEDNLSEFERLFYLIEYDRLATEELSNKFRLSANDLPIGITIFIMLIGLANKF